MNNQTTILNGKKNKTSHTQDKVISKQDSTTILKNEQTIISSNDTDSKTRPTLLSTTQPKKEKPTAK